MLSEKTKRLSDRISGYLVSWFSMDVGIDLGTCTTLISLRDKGIVLNEPSVVAIKKGTNTVLSNGDAVGFVAHEMLGKTPSSIVAIRPMKNGVIGDFEATEAMLGCFIKKAQGTNKIGLIKPQVVVAVPSGITQVERRAVIESVERAGARKVYLVDEPMAAGIGSGLPVANPTASMIIDIGGGTTEVAIISLADIASCKSIRVGGDAMDEAIIDHLKKTYNLLVGESRAEKIKIEIGSASPLKEELTMEIAGRDTISGMPRKIIVTSEEIRESLKEPIAAIINAVTRTLEKAKPELAADLIDNGIHICGGGSLLRGMDTVLANATGLRVIRVEDPLKSVAKGTSIYLENLDMWKDTIPYSDYEYERV
jgi:rod shape-determining protein MreB